MSGFPDQGKVQPSRQGFTIIELVLVIAVIALSASLFIVNADKAIQMIGKESPTDVLFKSIRQARLLAVTGKTPIYLTYDRESGVFQLRDYTGDIVKDYPMGPENLEFVEDVKLWPIESMPLQSNIRDSQEFSVADRPIDAMHFTPNGISSFVAVELVNDPQIADPDWILIDPFSNGELEGTLR